MRRRVLLLFFLSGACGLVYQVVWARMMTHAFGTTALAVGTVLAAFMSGLAAGSWLIGRVADRSASPLRLYAGLELGVGLAALVAHLLLDRMASIYVGAFRLLGGSEIALGAIRFLLAFLLVMAPTMLMGATLPVLARYVVTRRSRIGARLSTLYAINTIGAVAGTLLTGFVLIGRLGLHATVYLAVAGNLAIGAAAWWMADRVPAPAVETEARAKTRKPAAVPLGLVLVAFALSGLTSFAYEIYWTRSLVFLLGNSTYAVTTMLTAFLSGIALGGYLIRFVVDRSADRLRLFGWTQILIGVTSCLAIPLLFRVADPEALRIYLGQRSDSVGLLFAARFGLALLVMLVPATLIGATFPLVGRICVQDLEQTGSTVGRVYAVNTLGNVVGALLPGLLLLSWLGIQRGILAMAAVNFCIGLAFLVRRSLIPVAAIAAVIVVANLPLGFQFPSEGQSSWQRVLYYAEGPSATTKVLIDPDTRHKSMTVDGVEIGGTGFTDFKQQLLAHLPKLLMDDVSPELSIGLGSGILVGESARHDRVERIVCVEIEPTVIEGARWFDVESHGVMHDPRLQVVDDDVANHLRTTDELYLVVSADEKTAQDYASNGFSYSREYYELLRRRLAPNGLVVQWVPADLPPAAYAMVLETFAASFPAVQLWHFLPAFQNGPANTLLIGAHRPLPLDADAIRRRLEAAPESFAGLTRYGLTSAEALLPHYIAGGDAIRAAVAGARENTLAHPRYEFFPPREYAVPPRQRLAANHELLMALRSSAPPPFEVGPLLRRALDAEASYHRGYRRSLDGAPASESRQLYETALSVAPRNQNLRSRIFLHYWNAASTAFDRRKLREAERLMSRAMTLDRSQPHARVEHAIILLSLGQPARAAVEAEAAVELMPELVLARTVLADALARSGRRREAVKQLEQVLEIEPGHALATQGLAELR